MRGRKNVMRKVMLSLIGFTFLVGTPARALVMCQKKSGAVFVRETCKRKETALNPDALGLRGPAGPPGSTGDPGPFPTTLPSGQTVRGAYRVSSQTVGSATVLVNDTQSFVYPLASPPTVAVIPVGGSSTEACPGSSDDPQAAPGNLCIYATLGDSGPFPVCVISPETNTGCFQSGTTGFTLSAQGSGDTFSTGTWAVTAP
jgi:hypothetical protein